MAEKGSSKIVGKIVGFLIFILIIGATGAVIYFNIGNVTEQYIKPNLVNVPVLKNLIKDQPIDEYAEFTKEDMIIKYEELQGIIEKKDQDIENLNTQLSEKQLEIERLSQFEKQQVQFENDRVEFDNLVVNSENAPSIEEYIKFYEKIYPDNADKIYREAVIKVENDKSVKEYAQTYEQMDSANAAAILSRMYTTDMDLVVLILSNISDSEQKGKILGEMDSKIAARISKKMAPIQ